MGRPAPHRYVSKVVRPPDFDAFWEDVLAQAALVPMNVKVVPDKLRSADDVNVYEVFYDSLDHVRVAAWYCVPKDGRRPLPAILHLPGYQSDPPVSKEWARLGYATLTVAPRGKVRSNKQFNPGYPGLLTYSIVDRNTYSYRGFYVDAWRGVDFLMSRNEVDARRIGATGSSQGGGLTITTAAMRPEIVAAAAGAPYLCGFIDAIALENTYPYQEINDYLNIHPESRDQVVTTLRYFDGINFASRIQCPIIVNIGLQDNVCPPETGYATFNAIGSQDRKMYPYDGHGHDAGRRDHAAIVEEFFRTNLEPEQA